MTNDSESAKADFTLRRRGIHSPRRHASRRRGFHCPRHHSSSPSSNTALFALVHGAMGASGLVGQAIASLTKDGLRLSPPQAAVFAAVAAAPAYFGPLYGLLSDSVPLFGTRRKGYLVAAGLLGAVAWMTLGMNTAPGYYRALLLLAAAE